MQHFALNETYLAYLTPNFASNKLIICGSETSPTFLGFNEVNSDWRIIQKLSLT